ncbi:hypothetical protein HRbin36_01480 [bacterium HR36]|nr:hypothetical protein HRbin36_01480 [bacterium HR36]
MLRRDHFRAGVAGHWQVRTVVQAAELQISLEGLTESPLHFTATR